VRRRYSPDEHGDEAAYLVYTANVTPSWPRTRKNRCTTLLPLGGEAIRVCKSFHLDASSD
jgi:hypothetical protein